jgi:tRNA-specific 2-thiouridylase
MPKRKKIKALALLSGGLDSSLAAWLVKQQGVNVKALIFKSPFFGPEKGVRAAKQLNIPFQIIDISKELIELIKNPPHGFGGAANPCIDCHLTMIKKAKKIMEKENYDFVVTGEILGQRPFSQNKQAMKMIAKESGLGEKLVRPLSAQKLNPTLPEKEDWLDRNKLLDISGRSRKRQIKLAKEIDLSYPQPAGGCMLTEAGFAKKVFDLKKHFSKFKINDLKLLKVGRHFWQGDRLIVIGKDEEENKKIVKLAQPDDKIVYPANFIGPTALIRGKKIDQELITNTKQLILKHTPPRKQDVFKQPLIFFGSSAESILVLKKLLNANIPIGGIITKPDRQCGRGQKMQPCPLAKFAKQQNITTFKLEKLTYKTRQQVEETLKYKPHWGMVAVYGNIIPKSWLNWFNIILNIHPSLLPKWRGAAPTIRSIEAGDQKTGWTIFKLVEEMDAGPIIDQKKVKIKPEENAGQLTTRLFESAADQLIITLSDLYQTKSPKFWVMEPQNETKATYAEKVDKKEAIIDWSKPAEEIINKIHAFNPWPGAYTKIEIDGNKKRLKIWQAHLEKGEIILDTVHLAGKSRCSWSQFSCAYKISINDLKKN